MSESLNRLALVSRFSSHHLLGKLLPQPHELQEVVNNISNDTFARSTKKLTVDSSRLSKKHPKFSKDLESFLDSRQPETLGLEEVDGVSADERNALQTWNTIVDELLAFLCKLVEVTSSVYPSCWMVRLTMFEFLLVVSTYKQY
ncbi:hypothetical protein EON65_16455 [archaeon]|nr:MAG: hypothetical protein EON65_16455 [archaeon]